MDRPSKKDIKAQVEKLKVKKEGHAGAAEPNMGKLTEKKTNQRIRKQGI